MLMQNKKRNFATNDQDWEDTNGQVGILIYMELIDLPKTDNYF